MQVIQSNQALLGHLSNNRQWCTLIVVSLDDLEQIDAQDLEYGDEVLAMRTMMQKTVQELHTRTVIARDVLQLLWTLSIVRLKRVEPLRLHPV